jgi:hypothetical protein
MKNLAFCALFILLPIAPAHSQSCNLNTYGGSYSGSCSSGGIRYNVNGDQYGPTRVRGYLPDGGSFSGRVNSNGTFRGYVNGQPATCTRYGGCQ